MKYTQEEKDFRLALSVFLEKQNATLSIEETEQVDYNNIPNFGTIYKKTIQVEIPLDDNRAPLLFNIGSILDKDNVFNVHLMP